MTARSGGGGGPTAGALLERLNALLASGEVPGLWDGEAKGALLKAAANAWGGGSLASALSSETALMRAFTQGVERNLHVIFCAPPLGGVSQAASPALVNRCVLDFY